MDPSQRCLDELPIIHWGCIVEYGPDGRITFLDVPDKEEEKSSFESESAEFSNQNSFTFSTIFPDNASDEETNPACGFFSHKNSEIKEMASVNNEEKKKKKKKNTRNKKKGKKIRKNKVNVVPLNDEVPGSDKPHFTVDQRLQVLDELVSTFDERLQILDELVSLKMPAAQEHGNLNTEKPSTGDLKVPLVWRKYSMRMKLQGGWLSPVPEISECAECAAKGKQDTVTSLPLLPNLKEHATARQNTEKNEQAVCSENLCLPPIPEKRKPLSESKTKTQWSKLKLPSLIGKKKNQQQKESKTHEEHVREETQRSKLKLPILIGKKKKEEKAKVYEEHVGEEATLSTIPSLPSISHSPLMKNEVKPKDKNSSQLQNLSLPSLVTKVSHETTRNSLLPDLPATNVQTSMQKDS